MSENKKMISFSPPDISDLEIAEVVEALKPIDVEALNHYTDECKYSGHLYLTRILGITAEQHQDG